MDEVKLLPCPFCGGEAELCDPHAAFSHLAAVFCNDCEIRGQLSVDSEQAITFWNTRPTLVTDELVELREASAFLCQRMREFGGSDLGRLTGAVEQVERIIAAMPAIPPQSLDDHALPPSGLSG